MILFQKSHKNTLSGVFLWGGGSDPFREVEVVDELVVFVFLLGRNRLKSVVVVKSDH